MVGNLKILSGASMISRVFVAFMTLVLTMNMSMAASRSGIKEALDEFNYAMTVEGAALDHGKALEASAVLREKLKGIDREEVLSVALEGIQNKKTAAEIREALSAIEKNQLSPDEASQMVNDVLRRSYERGASWNAIGNIAMVTLTLVGMMAFMFGLMYVVTRSSDCPRNYTEEQCVQWDENVKW